MPSRSSVAIGYGKDIAVVSIPVIVLSTLAGFDVIARFKPYLKTLSSLAIVKCFVAQIDNGVLRMFLFLCSNIDVIRF